MPCRFKGSLKREDIKEEMVLLEESDTDYITPSGKIYKLMPNGLFFKKKSKINAHNGYVYVGITMKDGKNKNRRLHRLVAIAFIPNPNNYEIVGHKNNVKHDNRIDNLYWTTVQENTQKAFDDGLIVNAKGHDDSQSHPVIMYDLEWNEVGRYGSIRECSRKTGISVNAIRGQCAGEMKTKPRCGFYFKYQN